MSTSIPTAAVQPYLFFGGRCEEAIEFYRKALDAELAMLVRFKEAPEPQPDMPECFEDKVMHASLKIGDTILMASDGRCDGQATFEGFSLSITVADEAEADRVFGALSEGGFGDHASRENVLGAEIRDAEDRFGVGWMVSVVHKQESATA